MLVLLVALASARAEGEIEDASVHAELVFGFLAGDRTFGEAPFVLEDAGRPLAGLDAAFATYPLDAAVVVGPRLEARVVAPPLRISAGWQRAFPVWEPVPERREEDGAGAPVVSSVRALSANEVVLGLGVEAPTGAVVPFLDLVGTVHRARATLEVDGIRADYTSDSFSLGGRLGVRWQVDDHLFVEAAGEAAPIGPRTWGASVGFGASVF